MPKRRIRKIPSLTATLENLPPFLADPIEQPEVELAFPRTLLTADQSDWDEAHANARATVEAERDLRFALLTGLLTSADEPDWRAIARRIAVEFVPGFQVVEPRKPRGRRLGKLVDRPALLSAVDELLAKNEGWSVLQAAKALKGKGAWSQWQKAESLRAMYYQAKAAANADAKLARDRRDFWERFDAGLPPSITGFLAESGKPSRDVEGERRAEANRAILQALREHADVASKRPREK